jgi:hypothetical protein
VNTPITDIRDRLNAFVPGQQSTVFPDAPKGLLFPGDAGIAKGIAPVFWKGFMPRVGLAWNPDGRGQLSIRAAYGIFFDPMSNGSSLLLQAPVSSLPWTQLVQFGGPSVNFVDPYLNRPKPQPNTFYRPITDVLLDKNAQPPYAQNWNLSVQRELFGKYLVEARYVGSKGTHVPRNIEANPAVYGPGATAANADRRRLYANCPATGPCDFTHIAMLSYITNSTYHAGQFSLSRRYASGAGFNVSYWFSKTLDYLSAMNLSGSAARPLAGENDIAQNPFDLRAEHGPSLFDARHRFVFSGSWEIPIARTAGGWQKALLAGWQLNGIGSIRSSSSYTVFDSANVSLQASHPPISGFFASRPDVISDPNEDAPHTVEQWISRSAFRRLNPITEAGQFGDAGRNIALGPGLTTIDLSLLKSLQIGEGHQLQFRVECFNVPNHANFNLPVTDLASPSFGRIVESGPARLLQFGLKFLF